MNFNYESANFKRYATLYSKGLVSADEYENAQLAYKQAKEQVASAKEEVQRAQTNLGYATITSPIDGIVLSKSVEEGQTVAASFYEAEARSYRQRYHLHGRAQKRNVCAQQGTALYAYQGDCGQTQDYRLQR